MCCSTNKPTPLLCCISSHTASYSLLGNKTNLDFSSFSHLLLQHIKFVTLLPSSNIQLLRHLKCGISVHHCWPGAPHSSFTSSFHQSCSALDTSQFLHYTRCSLGELTVQLSHNISPPLTFISLRLCFHAAVARELERVIYQSMSKCAWARYWAQCVIDDG